MGILEIVVILLSVALVGFLVHIIVDFIPMHTLFKQAIVVACVVLVILYILTW